METQPQRITVYHAQVPHNCIPQYEHRRRWSLRRHRVRLFNRDRIGRAIVRSGNVAGARLIAAKPGDGHTFPDDFRCTGTHGRDPVTGGATTCGVKP
ncbi:hypothetical protein NtRootA4_24580 [Arthrobacter sp. NtRootA4]|nr:hypothetical protein NtRootA2_26770 [Arthrobacter sp. NtRootA2]BCW15479.1 hypothetical protein NtRootA4_24580 [Arthrobacter sp. NtRootA4]BCW23814.1 hypothetical protein NtRootC7_26810 [Arthrobacter sp. NtRootC7]BCW28081.1 hypothetical protein NtRootC45_26810 [Arthrobacter sp. NtRootC45]BCW32351.1 hypothetical protein NtRootD5_26820 [Arthrobacter sp. NtRootD5]